MWRGSQIIVLDLLPCAVLIFPAGMFNVADCCWTRVARGIELDTFCKIGRKIVSGSDANWCIEGVAKLHVGRRGAK